MTQSQSQKSVDLAAPSGQDVCGPTSRTAHTPGPWRCIEVEFDKYQTGEVAFVVSSGSAPMVGSVKNCALIAAAPDMLSALRELVRIRDWVALAGGCEGPLPQDVIQKFAEQQIPAIDAARAALAIADGAV